MKIEIETDKILRDKKTAIENDIESGLYQSLIDILLEKTGQIIKKVTRSSNHISYWFSAFVLALLTLILSLFISLLLNENTLGKLDALPVEIWTVSIAFASLVAAKIGYNALLDNLQGNTIEAIETYDDLYDLEQWLKTYSNIKLQSVFALLAGIVAALFAPALWILTRGDFAGFGSTSRSFLFGFLVAASWYHLFPFFVFLKRLGKYNLKLFKANPSSSEVIDLLSDVFTTIVYTVASVFVVVTLGLALFKFLNPITVLIFLVVLMWGPLLIIFVSGQRSLSNVINRAKWKSLNEIQVKIERLQTKDEIPTQDSLKHIRALLEYHDLVKNTRNSALDLRATLSFINSLLLPLAAFLLANLDKVVEIFTR